MPNISSAAAIIGISPLALQRIKNLHASIQHLHPIPNDLARVHSDITNITTRISDLEILSHADEKTITDVQKTGVSNFINVCGPQCEKLEIMLADWTKLDGTKILPDQLRLSHNSARVQNCGTGIWCAARLVHAAVGVLEMRAVPSTPPQAEQTAEVTKMMEVVKSWRHEAEQQHAGVVRRLDEVDGRDDDDVNSVKEELLDQDLALTEFVERCHDMVYMLRARKMG